MEPTHAELMELWKVCQNFVAQHEIGCAESIYQSDRVMIAAPELVEEVCNVVGYKPYEDEE